MIRIINFFIIISLSCTGCSLVSYGSQEALTGSVGGGLIGGAAGYAISRKVGNTSKNILINSAIGSAAGLAAGSFINQRNIRNAKKREVVVREAKLISKNQMELDKLRSEIYEASSWGNNETTTWDQRYPATYPATPYQGYTHYERPKQ